jgi:starch synthase
MHPFLPATDPLIPRKYSVGNVDQKVQNKTALQKELGWPAEPKRPLVCLPAGMTEKLGGQLLEDVLPGLLSLELEMIVLGKGSSRYGALFTKLEKEQKHRLHIMPEDEKSLHLMFAAADMALFLTDPSEMKEMVHALQYGVVPVSAVAASALEDYNPVQETGNAFLFEQPNKWAVFAQLVRACETYKFPFDWRTIQRHCMETLRAKERILP